MGIIGTIVIGFIVGLLARLLKPGRDAMGFILTTLLGIAGAFLGTWVGRTLGFYQGDETAGFIMSLLGAIVVLSVWGMLTRRKR
jgi:uncharacterized membrane protein YeaQ/YmgE (transglycosylase-associated protein family)